MPSLPCSDSLMLLFSNAGHSQTRLRTYNCYVIATLVTRIWFLRVVSANDEKMFHLCGLSMCTRVQLLHVVQALRNIPALIGLPEMALLEMAEVVEYRVLDKLAPAVLQEQETDAMFIILSGRYVNPATTTLESVVLFFAGFLLRFEPEAETVGNSPHGRGSFRFIKYSALCCERYLSTLQLLTRS